jgi:FOG: HEAT repeat
METEREETSTAIGGHPTSLADDDDEERSDRDDVKVRAVFALSQLPNREGIPPLLEVARSNAALAVRRSALFWLGQSGDPGAHSLFESLLRADTPSRGGSATGAGLSSSGRRTRRSRACAACTAASRRCAAGCRPRCSGSCHTD